MSIMRTKSLNELLDDTSAEHHRLKKTLKAVDLVAIGIGCIIGVGIFVLPGVEAATHAGPAIILSFAIAALACGCSALCYAELAAMIPVAGSAYTYGYATLGEIFAWIIGWDLILEYMVGASLVSIGWSAYFVNLVNNTLGPFGLAIPSVLTTPPFVDKTFIHFPAFTGVLAPIGLNLPQVLREAPWSAQPGILNLPAVIIVAIITWLLVLGIRESARVNLIIVAIKMAVLLVFIGVAVWYVDPANWQPFMPFGFGGVVTAAAIVFLAYVGFDAVSTTAEEAVNPQRDMPIGILGSLFIATFFYMVVAAIMTGVVSYKLLNVADPVALVLNVLQKPWASALVSVGAMAGITSVLLVLLMGQPRILFSMSRDRLLPAFLSRVHPRYRTPHLTTIFTGAVVAVAAALLPITIVAELCSIGTLFAFIIVCAGVIVLRYTRKEIHRPFKVPLFPYLPALGILLCGYLMISLPWMTWIRFLLWLLLGLLIYWLYSYRHSLISKR